MQSKEDKNLRDILFKAIVPKLDELPKTRRYIANLFDGIDESTLNSISDEVKTMLNSSYLVIDDALVHTGDGLLFLLAFVREKRSINLESLWIAYDPQQMQLSASDVQLKIQQQTRAIVEQVKPKIEGYELQKLYELALFRLYVHAIELL